MTYREALNSAADRLKNADIMFCDTPMLDAQVLLSFAADITREKLFASYPDQVPPAAAARFEELIEKRLTGLPVSYIRRTKEFFGRDFYVDEAVLVPRPDTEVLVEQALVHIDEALACAEPFRVLDLCTGSGCIAATLKLERPQVHVTASDVSPAAIEVARKNAAELGAEVEFVESSLFDALSGSYDIIVTNPPYLTSGETAGMSAAGWPEPELALDGGEDGLDLIRTIIKSSLDYLTDNHYLLIEAGFEQAEEISSLLETSGFTGIKITSDMAGLNRVTSGRKSGSHNK